MSNLTNTLNQIVDILEKQQKQIDKIENELVTLKLSIIMKDIKKDKGEQNQEVKINRFD